VGDETRGWPPFHGDTAAFFLSVNRNKRSLAVDLKTETGRRDRAQARPHRRCRARSYGTGVVERLGIDFATLKRERNDLIYCSISGFGRTGPLKGNLGYDVILQAFSGIMSMTGEIGGGPVRQPVLAIDQATGLHALTGIMAAILERNRAGEGCYLEVSLFRNRSRLSRLQPPDLLGKADAAREIRVRSRVALSYQAFSASDAPLLLGIANDNLWRRFCRAIDRNEIATDPRFETNRARVAHFAETVSLVQAIVATRSRDEWIALLTSIGVPCAPINTLRDLLDHPHTAARGIVLDYEIPSSAR